MNQNSVQDLNESGSCQTGKLFKIDESALNKSEGKESEKNFFYSLRIPLERTFPEVEQRLDNILATRHSDF